MPSLFNILVCILMMLIGVFIGKKAREHKIKIEQQNKNDNKSDNKSDNRKNKDKK